MGSVISEAECPKCHNPNGYLETYYKRGTEIFFCEKCGFNVDENGEETGGFGSYRIGINGVGATLGSFNKEEAYKDMEEDFKKNRFRNGDGKEADEVTYTFEKDGEWFEKDLIKNTITSLVQKQVIEGLK